MAEPTEAPDATVRIDRWLWAARIFKTRSLAKTAIEGGKVHVDGQRTKPAKDVRVGQTLTVSRGSTEITLVISALSEQRGPAMVAQLLYRETDESVEQREILSSRRRMERAGLQVPDSKPSKKDRRSLKKLKSLDEQWRQP